MGWYMDYVLWLKGFYPAANKPLFWIVTPALLIALVAVIVIVTFGIKLYRMQRPQDLTAELLAKGNGIKSKQVDEDDDEGPLDPDEMFLLDYKGPYPKCVCGVEIKRVLIYSNKDSDDCYEDQYRILACPSCHQILPVTLAE